jgi:hypothetical protein
MVIKRFSGNRANYVMAVRSLAPLSKYDSLLKEQSRSTASSMSCMVHRPPSSGRSSSHYGQQCSAHHREKPIGYINPSVRSFPHFVSNPPAFLTRLRFFYC